ncbi:uncharacterized protein PAN0_009d3906 [Moesziomyces antarcticus]|uniref:Uncharacterized protein n=2 Tax=Pseudozyma antarctica TaxID=84753 RepID=A0A081CG92_PSEA2|nr:uncharacterized protein PAN0_009d3906 [Moesziomyces antarcticus]GAK65688.1 conserved hypothetical protein [Moesziomyces antarcticus]SPO46708.1 uncharacterized protein PSANT_04394 [Moesziomyces antarcticus]
MSTQLLRGGNKDDLFEGEIKTPGQLPAQTYEFEDVLEHIQEALVEKRVSHNQAYRFKVLETIFSFFETARSQLLEAASQDFNGKAARVELELEYAFTLSQIAAALQSQCKPAVPGGALPDRFFSKLTIAGNAGGADAHVSVTRPVGAVLVVVQPKRPFDDLFAPLVSAVAAGNVVCAVLTPTMPSLNKVIVEQLTPQLPKSAVFVISPADMPAAQHGVADLREAASDAFGVEVPGSSHVATRISVPGSAYVSASLATAPSSSLPLGLGSNASKAVAERLRDVATEVVEGASMLLGRGVGAPKYLFVHEETYGSFREALLLAIATSSASLAPRDDGSKLEEIVQNEQTIGSKVANCGGSARLQKPFASEKRPGPVALIEVDVDAARAAKLSAVISDRKVVAQIKDLAALVLVGVSSTEHAFGLIEELGLDGGHMVVYSHDSAEVQHVLREVGPATLSINHIAPENLFSSYAPKPLPKSSMLHHHHHQQQASKSFNGAAGLRWPLELFQSASSTYLAATRSTSLGLSGVAASSSSARSALSSGSTNQRQLAVRKALAVHLAKTKRLVKRSRPTVSAPILRVFFLQGLFLFWGSALTCTLGGISYGAFKLSHWAWMRYVSA